MGDVWRLLRQGQVVAELEVVDGDFPWLTAAVHPQPGFEVVADLFRQELRQMGALTDEESPAWVAAYDAIRAQTTLLNPDGRAVAEYLLHIDGVEAWWRWSDEPFSDEDG